MNAPWQTRDGRLSGLKACVFAALFLPVLALAGWAAEDSLGPRPLTEAIHETGLWGIRLLFLSLAVTPLREALGLARLVLVRRMIGVAGFCYLGLHLTLYAADQGFDLPHVAGEIVRRVYLLIGLTGLLMLAALAATSTDFMVRRLGGRNWQRLHYLAYPAGLLATVHFFLQSKLDVREATVMGGLYAWLMLYRLRRSRGRPSIAVLTLLALIATAAAFGGEALYFWLKNGVEPARVLAAYMSFRLGPRPAWVVLGITAGVMLTTAARRVIWPAPARPVVSRSPPSAAR